MSQPPMTQLIETFNYLKIPHTVERFEQAFFRQTGYGTVLFNARIVLDKPIDDSGHLVIYFLENIFAGYGYN